MKIGTAIKQTRIEKGISQTKLSEITGISKTSLSLIENNEKVPNKTNLKKIGEALEVNEVYFYLTGLEISDVPDGKKETFEKLFPSIQSLLKQII